MMRTVFVIQVSMGPVSLERLFPDPRIQHSPSIIFFAPHRCNMHGNQDALHAKRILVLWSQQRCLFLCLILSEDHSLEHNLTFYNHFMRMRKRLCSRSTRRFSYCHDAKWTWDFTVGNRYRSM